MIDFIDEPVDVCFGCPLDLHCSYTHDQLLAVLNLAGQKGDSPLSRFCSLMYLQSTGFCEIAFLYVKPPLKSG